jgi:hypothetical protein
MRLFIEQLSLLSSTEGTIDANRRSKKPYFRHRFKIIYLIIFHRHYHGSRQVNADSPYCSGRRHQPQMFIDLDFFHFE